MTSISNKVLLINLLVFGLGLIMHYFWDGFGLKDSYYSIVFFCIYGLSSFGIGAGYLEWKNGIKKSIIGIIGNSILTFMILSLTIYIAIYYTR